MAASPSPRTGERPSRVVPSSRVTCQVRSPRTRLVERNGRVRPRGDRDRRGAAGAGSAPNAPACRGATPRWRRRSRDSAARRRWRGRASRRWVPWALRKPCSRPARAAIRWRASSLMPLRFSTSRPSNSSRSGVDPVSTPSLHHTTVASSGAACCIEASAKLARNVRVPSAKRHSTSRPPAPTRSVARVDEAARHQRHDRRLAQGEQRLGVRQDRVVGRPARLRPIEFRNARTSRSRSGRAPGSARRRL